MHLTYRISRHLQTKSTQLILRIFEYHTDDSKYAAGMLSRLFFFIVWNIVTKRGRFGPCISKCFISWTRSPSKKKGKNNKKDLPPELETWEIIVRKANVVFIECYQQNPFWERTWVLIDQDIGRGLLSSNMINYSATVHKGWHFVFLPKRSWFCSEPTINNNYDDLRMFRTTRIYAYVECCETEFRKRQMMLMMTPSDF
jgi:hypothetical protein